MRNTSSDSGRIRPPSHVPCSASAILVFGWSSVAMVKNIGEPIARSSDIIIGAVATCSTPGLPRKPATERGPWRATMCFSFWAISAMATSVGYRFEAAVRLPLQAVKQPIRIVVQRRERAPFRAGKAVVERRIGISVHAHDHALVQRHHDGTVGRADPASRWLDLDHRTLLRADRSAVDLAQPEDHDLCGGLFRRPKDRSHAPQRQRSSASRRRCK